MGRDSNPRWTHAHSSFQDCRLRPLGHPSKVFTTNDLRLFRFPRFRPLDTFVDTRYRGLVQEGQWPPGVGHPGARHVP